MFASNIISPVLLSASAALAVASGVDTVRYFVMPRHIEGIGAVSGPVTAGHDVLVDWVVTKRTDCPGVTSRVWYGQDGFQLTEPLQATSLPSGEAMQFSIQTKIPALAPPGELELHIVGAFECSGQQPAKFDLGPVYMQVTDGQASN